MPRPNNRSYNNDRNNNSRYDDRRSSNKRSFGKKQDTRASKFGKDNFNMLNFGQAFLDEARSGSYDFKARIMLKTKDGELADVIDGDGKGDNVYSPEESAMLIAKALLEGRAINICFFPQDDGSWGGNARIDIKGLDQETDEDEEPAPRKATKAKPAAKAKPKYEVPEDAEEDEDEITEVEETDEDDMPY